MQRLTFSPPTQKRYFVICWINIQYPYITYHLKDINECGLWITSPNKDVIVLTKMDLEYKNQTVWKIIDIRVY